MRICCGIILSPDDRTLDTHLRSSAHSSGIPCGTCGACFNSDGLLRRHLREGFHLDPPRAVSRFYCARCVRACVDQRDLDHHRVVHQFRCDRCMLDCRSQIELDRHEIKIHGRPSVREGRSQTAPRPSPRHSAKKIISVEPVPTQPLTKRPARPSPYPALVELATQHTLPSSTRPVQQAPQPTASLGLSPARQLPAKTNLPAQQAEAPPVSDYPTEQLSPREFFCAPCARRFTTQKALTTHISSNRLRCNICHAHFTRRPALNEHRSTFHPPNLVPDPVAQAREDPEIPRVKCNSCNKTFVNEYARDQHLVSNAHPENRVGGRPGFVCHECRAVFRTRDLLTLHAVGHVQERLTMAHG